MEVGGTGILVRVAVGVHVGGKGVLVAVGGSGVLVGVAEGGGIGHAPVPVNTVPGIVALPVNRLGTP